jgi:hypothetical protein
MFAYPLHDLSVASQYHNVNALKLVSNPRPLTSPGLALTPSYPSLAKLHASQSRLHTHVSKVLTYPSTIFDSYDGGSKCGVLIWNFYSRCNDNICTCGKKFKNFQSLIKILCAISKVTLVICVWPIFKLDFDLDDDLYWIWASLTK